MVLESYEYGLLLLPSLICTAPASLLLVFQIGQPTYMFFHSVLKKNRQKTFLLFVGYCFGFFFFNLKCVLPFAEVLSFKCACQMSFNINKGQVEKVRLELFPERSCRPDVHHAPIQNPPHSRGIECCFTPLHFPACCSKTAMPL